MTEFIHVTCILIYFSFLISIYVPVIYNVVLYDSANVRRSWVYLCDRNAHKLTEIKSRLLITCVHWPKNERDFFDFRFWKAHYQLWFDNFSIIAGYKREDVQICLVYDRYECVYVCMWYCQIAWAKQISSPIWPQMPATEDVEKLAPWHNGSGSYAILDTRCTLTANHYPF